MQIILIYFDSINMLRKSKEINDIKIFLYFLSLIFIFRSIFLSISLGSYPWFYEWEALQILSLYKNNEISLFEFLKLYEIKNQIQIFTKAFYVILFNLNNQVWSPKTFTILMQIFTAIYMSLIIKNLFYDTIKSKILIFLLFSFSMFPASLTIFYHFSESHFTFHLLISIISFEIYSKLKSYKYLKFILLIFLFIFAALNMEFVALTLYVTFACFYLYKTFETFNKTNLILFVIILLFSILYYKSLYFFEIPSINDGSQLAKKEISRSLYLIIKGLFHQNNLIFGIFLVIVLFNLKFYLSKLNENKNRDFIMLLTIFCLVLIGSIAFSRIQIYDRYKDMLQIGGFLSLFIFMKTFNLKKYYKYFLLPFVFVILLYNCIFFLDKFFEKKNIIKIYDDKMSKLITKISDGRDISKQDLDEYSEKYLYIIENSVENRLIKIQ